MKAVSGGALHKKPGKSGDAAANVVAGFSPRSTQVKANAG
jgi:hypothetical protein